MCACVRVGVCARICSCVWLCFVVLILRVLWGAVCVRLFVCRSV